MTGGKFYFTRKAPAMADEDAAAGDHDGEAGQVFPAAFPPAGDDDAPAPGPADLAFTGDGATGDAPGEESEHRAAYGWMVPALLGALALAWTLWFGISHAAGLGTGDPVLVSGLVGLWAPPALLLAVLWLIIQRSSRREAGRFTDAARLLRLESEALEARLTVVNRELSLAREFVASQSRDLESVGRIAVDRLSEHADRLAALIRDNGAQVEAIGTVSAAALENMERLRGQLPVMTSAAKDVTNNIGNAGRAAYAQVQELIAGFHRLNDFGQASERQVNSLRARIDEALASFGARSDELDVAAKARMEALSQGASDFHARLLDHQSEVHARIGERSAALAQEIGTAREALDAAEAEGLTSLRARLGALRDEAGVMARTLREGEAAALAGWREAVAGLEAGIGEVRARLAAGEAEAGAAMETRIEALAAATEALATRLVAQGASFDAELARRQAALEAGERAMAARIEALLAETDAGWAQRQAAQAAQIAALAASGDSLRAGVEAVAARVEALTRSSTEAEAALAARLDALARRIEDARTTLAVTEGAVDRLTDGSVRLLELIQASARHSEHDLTAAIGKGEARLAEIETRAANLREAVTFARGQGEELSAYVLKSHEGVDAAAAALAALHDDLGNRADAHGAALAGLGKSLAALDADAARAAERAQGELSRAIAALEAAAREAVERIGSEGAGAVETIATRLGEESGAAIEKALRLHAAEIGGRLEQAAAHAAGISREATVQLRDQLGKVDELIGNLEARVAQARARAEEQVDNDFSRRAALITESLNSNAIDIAKALDTDVTDTAWAAYLRGDRGVFTRRAVRLLDAGEAKGVAGLYENDRDFRDHVARYIHDFEAMLRQLLSTRDGHALGVTLLSSDMGKLYVALAQAIERLRD